MVQGKQFKGDIINCHFSTMTHKQLVYSLPHFIHEVAKKDSSPYPAETLHSMVMSFQDALQAQGKEF